MIKRLYVERICETCPDTFSDLCRGFFVCDRPCMKIAKSKDRKNAARREKGFERRKKDGPRY